MASFCEHGNKPSGFVKFEQFGMSLFVCLYVTQYINSEGFSYHLHF